MPGPGNSKQRKKQKEKKKKEAKKKAQQAASAIQNSAPEPHVDAPETPLETVPERSTQDSKVVNRPEEYVLYYGEYYEKIPEDELALYEGQEAEVVAPQYGVEDEDEGEGTMAVYDDEGEVEVPVTLELPYIYDPGNGPRVKDFLAFMRSRYAAPQAQSFAAVGEVEEGGIKDSPRDARWDASRVLPILSRLLPGELAT
ncbi:hypothetical protein FS842_007542, partial [Serendipita sp. 407]